MTGPVLYVVTRNNNGIYKSIDQGATFTQIPSTALTNEVTDIAVGDRKFTHSVITYGDGAATTPYYSFDDGVTYQAGQNTVGKEVTYVGQFTYVFGATNSALGSGAILEMSFDEGISIGATIDVTPVFGYTGAVFNNITVTGFDFPNSAGGYITVAGNQNNNSADQILTRTYDRGVSFVDALILPGSMGIIRGVWTSPERNVVFAIGNPDNATGALYSINPSLTEAPVKVLDSITVGSITNNLTVKFASVPPTYNTEGSSQVPANTVYIRVRSKVYFLDSAGRVYYSNDDGFTWEFRSQISAVCVDIVALNENTVLVLSKSPAGIFKSTDGGRTFIESSQPSWIDPRAIAYNFENDCDDCNLAFEAVTDVLPKLCTVYDRRIGTLCKSPYLYSSVLEACAKPSTIVPTNLILSLDYSGSVGPAETQVFREYMQLIITKVEDRLLDGSMQIAIIGWSTNACIQQPFTNDINLLRAAIDSNPPGDCFEGATNHTAEICLSIRTMYEQSVLRPTAENVLVIFTDSGDNAQRSLGQPYTAVRGCDLSDIGLLPVVPPDDGDGNWDRNFDGMYQLVKNAKTDLNNGATLKIMTVSLGNSGERASSKKFFLTVPQLAPLDSTYVIPSIVPNTNNYYYFDAGSFDSAVFIADEIRLGLAAEIISSPECPDGCIGVPGRDSLGYCSCDEEFNADPCTYEIVNCATGQVVPIRRRPGNAGYVVRLRPRTTIFNDPDPFFYDGGEGCWLVRPTDTFNPNYFNVGVDNNFGANGNISSCPACNNSPWFRFTDCLESSFVIYTTNFEFQEILDAGTTIITHANYPNRCLLIENIGTDGIYTESNITVSGIIFSGVGCQECPREQAINYKLTDCSNPTNIIYSLGESNDLQGYVGQYVRLEGFGQICWLIETDTEQQTIYQDVVITANYPDCPACLPTVTYGFTNCQEESTTIYTRVDFSEYVGQVVRLQEYPGNCWSCFEPTSSPSNAETLTISGSPFLDCPSCIISYYQLTNCANPEVFLISSTDLSLYLGRTITAAGYPGLCFKVSDPKCDCIQITVNDVQYSVHKSVIQYNGRNLYLFESESGDSLGLAWNINPSRWELFNTQTLETYGFSAIDAECPFSNFWTIQQGATYIISAVTFCVDRIYNVAPELDFGSCDPCINCI